jgi:hypothetical protein
MAIIIAPNGDFRRLISSVASFPKARRLTGERPDVGLRWRLGICHPAFNLLGLSHPRDGQGRTFVRPCLISCLATLWAGLFTGVPGVLFVRELSLASLTKRAGSTN